MGHADVCVCVCVCVFVCVSLQVTDHGLAALAESPSIVQLDVSGSTHYTTEGACYAWGCMLSCLTDNPIVLAGINSLARGQLGANIETLKVSHHRELHDVSPLLRCDRLRVLVGIECPHWRSIPQLLAKGVRVVHGSLAGVAGYGLGDVDAMKYVEELQ